MNFMSAVFSFLTFPCFHAKISEPHKTDCIAKNTIYFQSLLSLDYIWFQNIVQNSQKTQFETQVKF
jgi:hypothetical protein